MKILTLNKVQQKKLLQLCKEFFSEYSYINLEDYNKDGIFLIGFGYEDRDNIKDIIHWYQLCLTELPKRIFEKTITNLSMRISAHYYYGGSDFTGITQAMCFCQEHPVDSLYNFVQECKKNKYFK